MYEDAIKTFGAAQIELREVTELIEEAARLASPANA